MSLPAELRERLTLPAICAPMFSVTGPALVREACKAGVIGALPRSNADSFETFAGWLTAINQDLQHTAERQPWRRIAPMAVNLRMTLSATDFDRHLRLCADQDVQIVITAGGDPADAVQRVHDHGMSLYHDVTSLRFAEKAIAAGADGLTCIGAGGGGHSGTLGHLVLVPKVRAMFGGTVVMAGSVSTGAAIRAGEVLGADLAYLGTRFIATHESDADPEYKQLIVNNGATDLMYTRDIAGVPANWMVESMRRQGLDPRDLPKPKGRGRSYDHLPRHVRPWKTLWSAGQGIDLIDDVPTVAELVARLRTEYLAACAVPDMSASARLTADELSALSVQAVEP
jgi:nitronate monooxygenase